MKTSKMSFILDLTMVALKSIGVMGGVLSLTLFVGTTAPVAVSLAMLAGAVTFMVDSFSDD